jgi:hypothetical protein
MFEASKSRDPSTEQSKSIESEEAESPRQRVFLSTPKKKSSRRLRTGSEGVFETNSSGVVTANTKS